MTEPDSAFKEVDAMKAVAEALADLEPDERDRVLVWANAKFGSGQPIPLKQNPPGGGSPGHKAAAGGKTEEKGSDIGAKAKAGKKAKAMMKLDKSLNLTPNGKDSATDFVMKKQPTNVRQKCVVAAYYLREVVAIESVTADQVYTFFKHVGWELPSDMKNTLQQAGSEGWLDTANSDDIKITSTGENLIEHKLPAVKKAA